jgi:hypothetical protein
MSNEVFVKIPIDMIAEIASGEGGPEILLALSSKWAVVLQGKSGQYFTEGFEDQESCAVRVAGLHKDKDLDVRYVLKDGIPRKNVKIEVKAVFR